MRPALSTTVLGILLVSLAVLTAVCSEVELQHHRHKAALAQEVFSVTSMTVDTSGSITLQTAVTAVAGLLLVRRLSALHLREEHNDVAGFIYAALAVAYAVVLGFVLISVWERHEAARVTADREGSELASVYWLANRLPDSDRRQVQDLARSYAQVVIDEEWPMMQEGLSSPRAWPLMDQLRQSLQDFEPNTSTEEEVYAHGLERVDDLAEARRLRLLDADTHIPTILWVVLLAGGVITVSFTYLFGLKNTWVHTLMVAALTIVLTSILFSIYILDNPFAGDSRVSPEAFELDLQLFEER